MFWIMTLSWTMATFMKVDHSLAVCFVLFVFYQRRVLSHTHTLVQHEMLQGIMVKYLNGKLLRKICLRSTFLGTGRTLTEGAIKWWVLIKAQKRKTSHDNSRMQWQNWPATAAKSCKLQAHCKINENLIVTPIGKIIKAQHGGWGPQGFSR